MHEETSALTVLYMHLLGVSLWISAFDIPLSGQPLHLQVCLLVFFFFFFGHSFLFLPWKVSFSSNLISRDQHLYQLKEAGILTGETNGPVIDTQWVRASLMRKCVCEEWRAGEKVEEEGEIPRVVTFCFSRFSSPWTYLLLLLLPLQYLLLPQLLLTSSSLLFLYPRMVAKANYPKEP